MESSPGRHSKTIMRMQTIPDASTTRGEGLSHAPIRVSVPNPIKIGAIA